MTHMITETDRLYADLFTTAIEGGINYWCSVYEYHWCNEPPDDTFDWDRDQDFEGFFAVIDAEDGTRRLVNRDVIHRGYRLAVETDVNYRWSTGNPPYVITSHTRDNWDFDAGDADAIVQLGLLGKVIYG